MSHYTNPSLSQPKTFPGTRVLVVDDDDIVRGLHEAVLSLAGYVTESATNGEEALVMLAVGQFDLMVTDCNMPKLDGIGLIRTLRASGSKMPVVMISGSLMVRDLPSDVADEVAVALPKPARMSEIINGVAHAMRSTQALAPSKVQIADVFPTNR
jgi:two-component system, NarL family, capsular synthesis sensor histidine kinase RcsC